MVDSVLLQALAIVFGSEQTVRPAAKIHHVIYDEFLTPFELQALGSYLETHSADFVPSAVLTGEGESRDDESRKSSVFDPTPAIKRLFIPRLRSVLPKVLAELEITPFEVGDIQIQVTASGDGDFFIPHRDIGHERTNNRRVTFVYYAHREPASFTGGALRFHLSGGSFLDVQPRQNSVVFFDPRLEHEVLPVSCAESSLASSRITVNGWFCTEDPAPTGSPNTVPTLPNQCTLVIRA